MNVKLTRVTVLETANQVGYWLVGTSRCFLQQRDNRNEAPLIIEERKFDPDGILDFDPGWCAPDLYANVGQAAGNVSHSGDLTLFLREFEAKTVQTYLRLSAERHQVDASDTAYHVDDPSLE
ncbi:MAG: hypothetical protein M0000_03190 [Actinomycetota bacterium]|nr:hypothetical protein [Actinomycetota bacterium]